MVLPLVFTFGENQHGRGTIHAYGPKTPVEIKLPSKPRKVELDPDEWKTSTKGG